MGLLSGQLAWAALGASGYCRADSLIPHSPTFSWRTVYGLWSQLLSKARLRVGLKTEKLEEEIGKCLEKGEKAGGGALQAQEVAGQL